MVEDETGNVVQALLYRGTPDNPAMWPRALRDLSFAAGRSYLVRSLVKVATICSQWLTMTPRCFSLMSKAVISAAIGPSGENHVYLHQLDVFLESAADQTSLEKFDDTFALNSLTKAFREESAVYFLFGAGSNQHNQLLLNGDSSDLINGEDAHLMKEMVLCTTRPKITDRAINIFAGGGHSGLLTEQGRLFLWGWNESGQLGTSTESSPASLDKTLVSSLVAPLKDITVEKAALGFSHTLVVERGTGSLYAFGDNSRGQVDGTAGGLEKISEPLTPVFLDKVVVESADAGLFHSAVITSEGRLVTFGCGNFGQRLTVDDSEQNVSAVGSWAPLDGSRLVEVKCGRRHTVALDDKGRIWTFGDNKYGQLGRALLDDCQRDPVPALVAFGGNDKQDWTVTGIACGWSHTLVTAHRRQGGIVVFGWGRNDRGQLGTGSNEHVTIPRQIFGSHQEDILTIACCSESSVVVDVSGTILSCGWNEHGNLATLSAQDSWVLSGAVGAPITIPPGYPDESRLVVAAGGAHLLAMRVSGGLSPPSLARSSQA